MLRLVGFAMFGIVSGFVVSCISPGSGLPKVLVHADPKDPILLFA